MSAFAPAGTRSLAGVGCQSKLFELECGSVGWPRRDGQRSPSTTCRFSLYGSEEAVSGQGDELFGPIVVSVRLQFGPGVVAGEWIRRHRGLDGRLGSPSMRPRRRGRGMDTSSSWSRWSSRFAFNAAPASWPGNGYVVIVVSMVISVRLQCGPGIVAGEWIRRHRGLDGRLGSPSMRPRRRGRGTGTSSSWSRWSSRFAFNAAPASRPGMRSAMYMNRSATISGTRGTVQVR